MTSASNTAPRAIQTARTLRQGIDRRVRGNAVYSRWLSPRWGSSDLVGLAIGLNHERDDTAGDRRCHAGSAQTKITGFLAAAPSPHAALGVRSYNQLL